MNPKISFNLVLGIFSVLLIHSCKQNKKSGLEGVWEIEALKITMNSYQNSDSNKIIQVTAAEWEEKMHSRNIQTHYNLDGKYHSIHKNLQDSIVYDPSGTWRIEHDTLIIQDTFPKQITYKFKVGFKGEFAEFWGLEDFDQDGKVDDEYYSKQKKLR